jgi:hypothetical protein
MTTNLIKTGTRSISIADRAVAATMPENLTMVTNAETKLPDNITQAFVGKDEETIKQFLSRLKEIKTKWEARKKLLVGKTSSEKRADYRVFVTLWAQENGAPNFTLDAPKVERKKKTSVIDEIREERIRNVSPLNLKDEFGETTNDDDLRPAPVDDSAHNSSPVSAETAITETDVEELDSEDDYNEFED